MEFLTLDHVIYLSSGAAIVAFCLAARAVWTSKLFRYLRGEAHGKTIAKTDVDQHSSIYTALVELRAIADADRAYVIRFHNGHEFVLNDPIWKCTCTHEVVRPGITYEASNIQNLLVSRMVDIVAAVVNGEESTGVKKLGKCEDCIHRSLCEQYHKYVTVIQIADLPNGFSKFYLQSQNIKTIVQCGLVSKYGAIGIVAVDLCAAEVRDQDRLDLIADALCHKSDAIQFMVSRRDPRKSFSEAQTAHQSLLVKK